MQIEHDRGIVLKLFPYSESSHIVSWLTEQHGLIRTLAKGSRQSKSRSFSRLDLFMEAEIAFNHSRTSHLHTLREAASLTDHLPLRQDFSKTCAASYFVELVAHTLEPDGPVPTLHSLLQKALTYLESHEVTLRIIERFELRLATELGLASQGDPPDRIAERLRVRELKSRPLLMAQLTKV